MRAIAAGDQIAQRDRKIAEHLVTLGVLAVEKPQQFVLPKPDFIWLPNEFVTGAENENPPLELLRQTQDVMALRLAIELYHAQNLRRSARAIHDMGVSSAPSMAIVQRHN